MTDLTERRLRAAMQAMLPYLDDPERAPEALRVALVAADAVLATSTEEEVRQEAAIALYMAYHAAPRDIATRYAEAHGSGYRDKYWTATLRSVDAVAPLLTAPLRGENEKLAREVGYREEEIKALRDEIERTPRRLADSERERARDHETITELQRSNVFEVERAQRHMREIADLSRRLAASEQALRYIAMCPCSVNFAMQQTGRADSCICHSCMADRALSSPAPTQPPALRRNDSTPELKAFWASIDALAERAEAVIASFKPAAPTPTEPAIPDPDDDGSVVASYTPPTEEGR